MANPTPIDKGREFLSELLPLMSDTARAELEAFVSSGTTEAQAMLARIGNGALRQSDYSRGMNTLKAQETQLTQWSDQLKAWKARADEELAMAGSPDPAQPAAPAAGAAPAPSATSGLSIDDARKLVAGELNNREAYFAAFVGDSMLLAQQHQLNFGEPLNIQALLDHPEVGRLGLKGAYEALHKDKLDAKAKALQEKERERIREEVRQELIGQGVGSQLPYAIPGEGQGSSPLDHLSGVTPAAAFDPAASAAMYRQLVASKAT